MPGGIHRGVPTAPGSFFQKGNQAALHAARREKFAARRAACAGMRAVRSAFAAWRLGREAEKRGRVEVGAPFEIGFCVPC